MITINNQEVQKVFTELFQQFEQERKNNSALTVEQFIETYLPAQNVVGNIKESCKFIDQLDKNTAAVIEDTKQMRLNDWVEKNVFAIIPESNRQEFRKGIAEAAEQIKQQSINEFLEER